MTDTGAPDQWICEWLTAHGISFTRFDHPAVNTCDEADRLVPAEAVGIQTKNLFLRDKKGQRHLLAVTSCTTPVDLRALGDVLDAGRLSFGSPERLVRYLGVTPGAVTLLALAFAGARDVELVIDAAVWTGEPLRCHPMTNTATLVLSRHNVEQFLRHSGHTPRFVTLPRSPTATASP